MTAIITGAAAVLLPAHPRAQVLPTERYELAWTVAPPDSLALIQPRSILITNRCEVWIADPAGRLVYRWRCDGSGLGRVGRAGRGPGEFRGPWSISQYSGDTVVVWDASPQMYRLSFMLDDGTYVHGRTLRPDPSARGRLDAFGKGPDGPLVWLNRIPRGVPGVNEDRSYVWTIDAEGMLEDSIVGMNAAESIVVTDAIGTSRMDAPFQRRSVVLFLPERGFLVGNTGDNELVWHEPTGRVVSRIDLGLPASSVSEHHRAAYVDSARAGLHAELERSNLGPRYRDHFTRKFARMLQDVDFPEKRQRYVHAAVGPALTVWVALPGESLDYERTWHVYDLTSGQLARVIRVPHRWPVRAAAPWHDGLYVVEVSADGFSRVAKYVPSTTGDRQGR